MEKIVKIRKKPKLLKLAGLYCMRPDEMQPRTLRKLTDIVAKVLSIIFEESWKPGDLASYQRKGSMTFIFKKEAPPN